MGLESATYISGLNASNPINATDVVGEGDDHLRLIKSTLLNTFPNITGAMSLTHTQLNNAAIKTENNVFTSNIQTIQGTAPQFRLAETGATANEGNWGHVIDGSTFTFRLYSDDYLSYSESIRIIRSGINATNIYFKTTNLIGFHVTNVGECRLYSVGNTDTETRRLTFMHQDSTQRGFVGYSGGSNLQLYNQVHGGITSLYSENAVGAAAVLVSGDPDGAVTNYYAGSIAFQTAASGANIRDTDADDPVFSWKDNAGTTLGRINHVGTSSMIIESLDDGVPIVLRGEDAGGVLRTLFNADPDGAAQVYYNGNSRIETSSQGIAIRGDANSDAVTRIVDMLHLDGTRRGYFGHAGGTSMYMVNAVHGANIILQAEDAGGTARNLFNGDPDSNAFLYYNGNEKLKTVLETATGATSSAQVKDSSSNYRDVGFNDLPIITEDTSDTLDSTHAGGVFFKDGVTGVTLTLEASTSTDFPVGAVCTLINANGTGNITVTEGATTTLYLLDGSTVTDTAGGCTLGPGGIATLWREAAGIYYIFGQGLTA